MLRELNKILIIIVLVLLQTLTPLAHAHAGKNDVHQGLHIPGLESFHSSHNVPFLANVNNNREGYGLLVMVEAGINTPHHGMVEKTDHEFSGLPGRQVSINLLPENDQNYSPHFHIVLSDSFLFSSHSPRAPPVL